MSEFTVNRMISLEPHGQAYAVILYMICFERAECGMRAGGEARKLKSGSIFNVRPDMSRRCDSGAIIKNELWQLRAHSGGRKTPSGHAIPLLKTPLKIYLSIIYWAGMLVVRRHR